MKLSFAALVLLASLFVVGPLHGQQTMAATAGAAAASDVPAAALIQPNELAAILGKPHPPLILQVGSHVMYAEAHIPGAEYAGAAGTSEGLASLRKRVATTSKDQAIVLYCGCCPWGRCPNIRPALRELQTLGFTHVKALYLADNFGADWVSKGFPVAKGR